MAGALPRAGGEWGGDALARQLRGSVGPGGAIGAGPVPAGEGAACQPYPSSGPLACMEPTTLKGEGTMTAIYIGVGEGCATKEGATSEATRIIKGCSKDDSRGSRLWGGGATNGAMAVRGLLSIPYVQEVAQKKKVMVE